MSMFPCQRCGGMMGVVGTTIFRCACPPTGEAANLPLARLPQLSSHTQETFDWRERLGYIIDHASRIGSDNVRKAVNALLYEFDALPKK